MYEQFCKIGTLVCLVLLMAFSCFSRADSSLNTQKLVSKIERSQGKETVEAVIEFVNQNFHFKTEESIKYGRRGLALLEKHGDADLASRLHSALARAYISRKEWEHAQFLTKEAQKFADESKIATNQIRAKLLMADIGIRQRNSAHSQALIREAIDLASFIRHDSFLAQAYRLSGTLNVQLRHYEGALSDYLQSLGLYRKVNNTSNTATVHQNLASLYRAMNMYEEVLFHQNRAIELALILNDERKLSIYYSNMGTYFEEVKEYEDAIEMHLKSLSLKEKLGYKMGKIHTYNRLGSVYRLAGMYKESEQALKQAIALKEAIKRSDTNVSTYLDLGRLYIKTGQLDLAEGYLKKSIPLYQGSPWEDRIAEIYQAFGQLYLKQNAPDKAIDAYLEAIKIAREHERDALVIDYYREVADIFESQGAVKQVLQFIKAYVEMKEKWDAKNNQYRLSALVVEFDVAEKTREIASLTQQNKIKDLELERQSIQQAVIFISLLLAFSILLFLYYWHAKNKQLRVEKHALRLVSEAKERLSLALWGSGDELWDWNLQSGVISRDNQMNHLRLPAQQIGRDLNAIKPSVHPDDYALLDQKFNTHLQGKSDFYEVSYRVMTETGDWLWVLDRGKVTSRFDDGTAQRVSGTIKDISFIKASELALAELNETLEKRVEERTISLQKSRDELVSTLEELTSTQATLVEAQKMASLGRLVAGVSHELNTPLGNSITASSVLREELTGFKTKLEANKLTRSETQHFMQVSLSSTELIESNIDRAARLVKRFKQVSVHEDAKREASVDIKGCIETFMALHGKDNQADIEITCTENLYARCDAHALEKILGDLFANSLHHGFNGQKGKILISAKTEEGLVIITFNDNGKGIDEDTLPHVFEPFFTTARHKGNVGLGLYLVFSLVTHVLQGHIRYLQGEKGATFEIVFPAFLMSASKE